MYEDNIENWVTNRVKGFNTNLQPGWKPDVYRFQEPNNWWHEVTGKSTQRKI